MLKAINFDFVKDTAEMLKILKKSMEHGNAVGISSPVLGTGIHITAVEKIIENDYFDKSEFTIVLKGYDITGYSDEGLFFYSAFNLLISVS